VGKAEKKQKKKSEDFGLWPSKPGRKTRVGKSRTHWQQRRTRKREQEHEGGESGKKVSPSKREKPTTLSVSGPAGGKLWKDEVDAINRREDRKKRGGQGGRGGKEKHAIRVAIVGKIGPY